VSAAPLASSSECVYTLHASCSVTVLYSSVTQKIALSPEVTGRARTHEGRNSKFVNRTYENLGRSVLRISYGKNAICKKLQEKLRLMHSYISAFSFYHLSSQQ